MKESVIVYALGTYWRNNINELKSAYEVIACSDQNPQVSSQIKDYKFILPEELSKYPNIKIVIGCIKQEGMRERVALQYNIHAQRIFYWDEMFSDAGILDRKKEKHSEKLTVVIPTYNRKKRLNRTLDLLEMQTDSDFKIVILDNCSDYDINEILENRNKVFCNRIEIVRNKINIGMAANIANAFIQGINGWMWLLSDDDIPSVYAVENIYSEIEHSSELWAIHFLYHGFSEYMTDKYKDFNNLHQLLNFYKEITVQGMDLSLCNGDFIYLSNKIYNMKYIYKYCQDICLYSYLGAPHLIPILFMLNSDAGILRFRQNELVVWDAPDGGHWDYIKTLSGMRIVTDFPLEISHEEKGILYNLFLYAYMDSLLDDIEERTFDYDIGQIDKIYSEVYRYCLDERERKYYYEKIQKLKEGRKGIM